MLLTITCSFARMIMSKTDRKRVWYTVSPQHFPPSEPLKENHIRVKKKELVACLWISSFFSRGTSYYLQNLASFYLVCKINYTKNCSIVRFYKNNDTWTPMQVTKLKQKKPNLLKLLRFVYEIVFTCVLHYFSECMLYQVVGIQS